MCEAVCVGTVACWVFKREAHRGALAEGEEAAANAIRYNNFVLMSAGFPKTAKHLREAGYQVKELGNSECAKLDGGMSCLSLRF